MNIFATHAPRLWAKNLPVIPCNGKRPVIRNWQRFCESMPDPKEQSDWLDRYPGHNIGLPLGQASGYCVVDIDTEDQSEIAAVKATLPASPLERVGKKGSAIFYKFNREKSFSIAGKVDFLSTGKQVILPPSIHPETGMAYRWIAEGL